MKNCYIQLYSLKDETAKDFTGTLEKVAKIGYTGVEFAAGFYGGLTAAELKAKCGKLGLTPLGSHIRCIDVPGQLGYLAELGVRYIIDPMAPMSTKEEALAFAKVLNETGKLCHMQGIIFGYHNHRHEFLAGEDGYLLETLLKNTDPQYVCFQLDVGWAACAGVDVPAFINKYPGRFKLIHVKECNHAAGAEALTDFSKFSKDENGRPIIPAEVMQKFADESKWNAPSGQGIINWAAVRDAALAQGAEEFIVEREYDYAGNIFKCIEEDYAFLKAL